MKKLSKILMTTIIALALFLTGYGYVSSEEAQKVELKMIAPPAKDDIKKAIPELAKYIARKIPEISNVTPIISESYNATGVKFEKKEANLLLAGSFLTFSLCKRDLALPLVRGVNKSGVSTYKSVLICKKDVNFKGLESVKGKKITYVKEASSGELFARSFFEGKDPVADGKCEYIPAKNQGIAIKLVGAGKVEFGFVKNTVWEKEKANYPDLKEVDKDAGENPDNVIIVSKEISQKYGEKLKEMFLSMEKDPEAKPFLDALGVVKFIATTMDDYKHTEELLKKANIDPKTYKFSQ